jgi:predicted dinucleotide-binding enzyme
MHETLIGITEFNSAKKMHKRRYVMKIGIIGSGMVAQQLGLGFLKLGHEVMLGTRHPDKLNEWLIQAGKGASVGSFKDAAGFGELIALATLWNNGATEEAIRMAGKDNFAGKIVMDVTNPLAPGGEKQPPKLALAYPDSAGVMVQSWLPKSKVVKAFNTITAYYMANPKLKEGTPTMFIAGNDASANNTIKEIAEKWGWDVEIVGGIEQSYLLEALAMLWIRYGFLHNYWKHAFKLLKE